VKLAADANVLLSALIGGRAKSIQMKMAEDARQIETNSDSGVSGHAASRLLACLPARLQQE
jgi:hypothetical protein